jgi:hypothetical protein
MSGRTDKYKEFISMKKIALLLFLSLFIFPLMAERVNTRILTSVKEGKYEESDLLIIGRIPYLPIPSTKEDYAILQAIGKVTNVVIGRFKSGEREIVFLSDENNDGTVDRGVIYYPDTKKLAKITQPAKDYPAEQFKRMKLDIISGVSEDLTPNAEGSVYLKKLLESKSPLLRKVHFKNGFRSFINDPDDPKLHRVIFYYSNNQKADGGVDLAFEVIYRNVGSQMIAPVVKYSVYAKGSTDPVIAEVVSDLSAVTAKFFGE